MTLLESLSEIVCAGSVARVGLGSSSAQIREALGAELLADRDRKALRLDYGMLEFNLYSDRCETISVQLHRLAGDPGIGATGVLPIGQRAEADTVALDDLQAALIRRCSLNLAEGDNRAGYRCYRVVGRHVMIYVVSGGDIGDDSPGIGDIWSINIVGAG
ncbi:hypothetical protein [Amycolatopsis sp. cmx-4-61]|uniref:hypothetical protein n=1 Tax=Amycolatopsis sp. cmx-4-61 TaxID=2790937 RepID=UPI00397D6D15